MKVKVFVSEDEIKNIREDIRKAEKHEKSNTAVFLQFVLEKFEKRKKLNQEGEKLLGSRFILDCPWEVYKEIKENKEISFISNIPEQILVSAK